MSLVVHLPEELARRVTEAAAARGVSAEELAVEAIAALLPAVAPLEAFIGSGDTGDAGWATRDLHELGHELAGRRSAEGA